MKRISFQTKMNALTVHHRKACKAYDDICNGVAGLWHGDAKGPFLPVSVFKDLELRSVPEDQIKRQLTSSGTTGQKVSRIFLDAETAADQQRALCEIVSEYIGEKRIPMLIIDSPDVLRDRSKYSARGAGIMGFSMMASKRFYALDPDMKLDRESIEAFIETAGGDPCFAFGFTYMIWQYFYGGLADAEKEGKGFAGGAPDLSNCHLIHGGGWKKLADQAVSNEAFKAGLKRVCGIEKVSDYYGMAEQTGSIFMECECGHLHASAYSDITCIDPMDFSEVKKGEPGLLALESTLPKSYPGHRLLTEDLGRILGDDDCPCGRPGRYFEVSGRIQKAELRGCSDTFAASEENHTESIALLAGRYPVESACSESFGEHTLDFLHDLSALFTGEPKYRSVSEIYALGFWCRRAHMQRLWGRQLEWRRQAAKPAGQDGSLGKGRGLVLHIAPSNMPTMFAYSWIASLLAGNSNVVRLSSKDSEVSGMILDGIREILQRPAYADLAARNGFIRVPRGDRSLEELSMKAAGRVIWGGDETVRTICEIPKAEGCIDVTFPDKYSIAVLDADTVAAWTEEELRLRAHLFYNDTYGADQNACSSPRTVFWIKGRADGEPAETASGMEERDGALQRIRDRWWQAVAVEAERYDLQPWMAMEKYRNLCCAYALHEGLGPVEAWGNRLYVVPCRDIRPPLWALEAKMGLFYDCGIDAAEDLHPLLDSKIQTVVTNIEGLSLDVDRVVAVGEALDFDTIWDRKDIIGMLSR